MGRLSTPSRETVPKDQVDFFDELVKENGNVPSHGPASILAHVPRAWKLEKELRNYLRHESSLAADIVDLAIIVATRELDCQFVWNSHAASGRKAGIPDDLINAICHHKALPKVPARYLAVVHYGWEFFRLHFVSPGTYGLVKDQFGERGVVELSLLFGNCSMLAALHNCTDAQLRDNRTEPVLPMV